ncbi:MAG: hypothetical protein PHO37_17485 [Kiritimatiellae bacterium]|nr:hypothetical protein [Kiritimatiellia bacterium]
MILLRKLFGNTPRHNSNTLRKVELKTDLLIPGHLILSLTGDA